MLYKSIVFVENTVVVKKPVAVATLYKTFFLYYIIILFYRDLKGIFLLLENLGQTTLMKRMKEIAMFFHLELN